MLSLLVAEWLLKPTGLESQLGAAQPCSVIVQDQVCDLELGHSPSCILLEQKRPFLAGSVVSVQCEGAVWGLGVGLTFLL